MKSERRMWSMSLQGERFAWKHGRAPIRVGDYLNDDLVDPNSLAAIMAIAVRVSMGGKALEDLAHYVGDLPERPEKGKARKNNLAAFIPTLKEALDSAELEELIGILERGGGRAAIAAQAIKEELGI